jgi:Tol biopolymer transport system component
LLIAVGAEPAAAAFPGYTGAIAYSKTSTDEVGEGTVESVGGLFARGPWRPRQPTHRLTSDPGDHSPSYSADGRRIVFVSDDGAGGSAIYVMNIDGTDRTLVTSNGAAPYFFPSGGAIVFVREVEGHSHLFTIQIDGSGLRQLTSGPYDDSDPAVSPSGKRIAFGSNRDPDGKRDRSDVFSLRHDGSGLRLLIDGPRRDSEPDWSPDGRRIVFVVGSLRSSIFVRRVAGGRARPLTHCHDIRCRSYVSPVFSPNGRHIAILGLGTRTSTISVIRSDGGGGWTTIDSGGVEEEGFGSHVGAPSWGPRLVGSIEPPPPTVRRDR